MRHVGQIGGPDILAVPIVCLSSTLTDASTFWGLRDLGKDRRALVSAAHEMWRLILRRRGCLVKQSLSLRKRGELIRLSLSMVWPLSKSLLYVCLCLYESVCVCVCVLCVGSCCVGLFLCGKTCQFVLSVGLLLSHTDRRTGWVLLSTVLTLVICL